MPTGQAAGSILIVDDDPANRLLLGDLIEASGYPVQRADSGAEALALAARHRPSVVLLDLLLPDTDGFAVCRTLLREDARIRVYIMSGLDDASARRDSVAAGAAGFLCKPLKLAAVLDVLKPEA